MATDARRGVQRISDQICPIPYRPTKHQQALLDNLHASSHRSTIESSCKSSITFSFLARGDERRHPTPIERRTRQPPPALELYPVLHFLKALSIRIQIPFESLTIVETEGFARA